eukprot:XP_015583295.1 RING-H2 finger protein ATL56 [Ricinus communis]
MPLPDPHHCHHNNRHHHGGAPLPKPNQKLLSIFLKVITMTAITTLFFLFLGVAAILLLLATAALHHPSSSSSNSSNGLSLKDLKKLPQFRFFSRKIMKPESEASFDCVICLEGLRQGQWCRKLAVCGHTFHRKCVDTWLVKVAACPICRTRVWLGSGSFIENRPLWAFRYIGSS